MTGELVQRVHAVKQEGFYTVSMELALLLADALEAAEARRASSTVLSLEDTEKLREALEKARAWMRDAHLGAFVRQLDAALALLDGRKEKQDGS